MVCAWTFINFSLLVLSSLTASSAAFHFHVVTKRKVALYNRPNILSNQDDQPSSSMSTTRSRQAGGMVVEDVPWDEFQEAWRASFSRNTFADFVPSDYTEDNDKLPQDCLMLRGTSNLLTGSYGSASASEDHRLPWDAQAQNSRVTHIPEHNTKDHGKKATLVFDHLKEEAKLYDVILDKGLLEDLIRLCQEKEDVSWDGPVRAMFQQASASIRDNGIYVLLTSPLSPSMQLFLTEVGEEVGLAWHFHLDGISNHHIGVSVARKMHNDYGGLFDTASTGLPFSSRTSNKRLLP